MQRSIVRRFFLPMLFSFALATATGATGCGVSREHDVAQDFEGTVSARVVPQLVRHVDLARAPVEVVIDREETRRFEAQDQLALEAWLRETLGQYDGDRAQVTQQVTEDTGDRTQRLTLTLGVEHDGETRYLPVILDLVREGKSWLITRVRVMSATR